MPAKLNFFKTPASEQLVSSRPVSTSTGISGCFQPGQAKVGPGPTPLGERLVEEARRRDRGDREIEERVCSKEERMEDKERERKSDDRKRDDRIQGLERTLGEGKTGVGKREERLQMLEQRVSKEEEGGRNVSVEVTALTGRVNMLIKGKDERERQRRIYEDERMEKERAESERLSAVEVGLKALEISVKEKGVDIRKRRESYQEVGRSEECGESGRTTAVEREEMERILAEKIGKVEEGLEKERSARMRLEEERRIEIEVRERKESIKQMESKVGEAMENVKIMNLRFEKVSKVKEELLKEAEGVIKEMMMEKDRKECEWILRKSRVYILGKGTEEKELGEERICTAPLLVKCVFRRQREKGLMEC